MANTGTQYETIGPNRSVDGDAVPALDNDFEGASQDFVAGAFLIDDGSGNLIEALRTVTGVTLSNLGSAYTSAPTVTATLRGALTGGTVTAGGSNYLVAPALTFSGSGGGAATALISGGKVVGMVVTTPATTGYTAAPTVTITAATNPDGTTGSGAAITALITGVTGAVAPTLTARVNGSVAATVTVTAAGTGYTSIPGVQFGAPNIAGGVQATGHAVLSTSTVGSIVVDNPGSGYTSAPTITIAGGAGSGATATCTISGALYDVQVTTAGSGMNWPPTIAFSGGGGSGAVGTTTMYPLAATIIAVADGDAHNNAVAGAVRILTHRIRGYKDELSGTYGTTSLTRSTDTFKEVGIKRDPITKRHYLDTSGSGFFIDGFGSAGAAEWADGDSYPICNFHVRSSYLKLV